MSYTIIQDPQQAKRDLENIVNQVKRHCRIGKVRPKAQRPSDLPTTPPWRGPYREWLSDPYRQTYASRKCSCIPGQPCGNAACPYGLTVTCGAVA